MKFAEASTNDDRSVLNSAAKEIAEALGVDPAHKGTSKLAADLEASKPDEQAQIDLILSTIQPRVEALDPGACARVRREWQAATEILPAKVQWCIWTYLCVVGLVEGAHDTLSGALANFNRNIALAERKIEIRQRIEREVAEVERLEATLVPPVVQLGNEKPQVEPDKGSNAAAEKNIEAMEGGAA